MYRIFVTQFTRFTSVNKIPPMCIFGSIESSPRCSMVPSDQNSNLSFLSDGPRMDLWSIHLLVYSLRSAGQTILT